MIKLTQIFKTLAARTLNIDVDRVNLEVALTTNFRSALVSSTVVRSKMTYSNSLLLLGEFDAIYSSTVQ